MTKQAKHTAPDVRRRSLVSVGRIEGTQPRLVCLSDLELDSISANQRYFRNALAPTSDTGRV